MPSIFSLWYQGPDHTGNLRSRRVTGCELKSPADVREELSAAGFTLTRKRARGHGESFEFYERRADGVYESFSMEVVA